MTELDEYKEDLIDLILWYRDQYHKKDFGHSELIEQVKLAQFTEELEGVEQTVDGWIDY